MFWRPDHGVDLSQPPLPQWVQSAGMLYRIAVLVLLTQLGACSSMLPEGSSKTPSPFASFQDALAALEKVVPMQTRVDELGALGFDAQQGANVTRVPYPDIAARLVPLPAVPLQGLDPGIRRCVELQGGCHAYLFRFERLDHQRVGSFWMDFFNLHRTTRVSGWWIEALIVVGGDEVLFRNHAGQPNVSRIERQTNPLGPFQPAGERAGSMLIK